MFTISGFVNQALGLIYTERLRQYRVNAAMTPATLRSV